MTSTASESFWRDYARTPAQVRAVADKKYAQFRQKPAHPSLRFKELQSGVWSARVTQSYRAVGYRDGDLVNWFWIGTHAEYERLSC